MVGVGLGGTDAGGEEFLLVAMEAPSRLPGVGGTLPKETMERLHLERYRFDHIAQRGTAPFEAVHPGADPPDFVIVANGIEVRLDCVAWALESRRTRYALFTRLRQRLAAGVEGRDFSGIAGTQVGIWFGEGMVGLPARPNDDAIITAILDLLAGAEVDRDAVNANNAEIAKTGGLPEQIPPGVITQGQAPDGSAGFLANVVCEPEEAVAVLGELGFQALLHMPDQVPLKEALDELQRIVDKHDKPEIEALLITAGGPDREGICYPAESLIASNLATEGHLTVTADHLKAATLHIWDASIHDVPITRPAGEQN
jgi:hypothetical protein